MMKLSTKKLIELNDFDELVEETYKHPYSLQQQDDCKPRGVVNFTVPSPWDHDEEMNDSIPELINGTEMGVKFQVWLDRDHTAPLNPSDEELDNSNYYFGKSETDRTAYKTDPSNIRMFYERNFYPNLHTLINDLHKKGLIEEGVYAINIDW